MGSFNKYMNKEPEYFKHKVIVAIKREHKKINKQTSILIKTVK